jgi:2-oxoglutarate ferredoxin oxidoreductase subunit alpha
MVEGIGLAGMTETPVVIVNGQRPGPAIGLPTRTEQADLEFVIYASHGEFPRAVFAPANAEDAFWLTVKAFNIADKYQIPVVILSDQHVAMSYYTVEKIDVSAVIIDRGDSIDGGNKMLTGYNRYAVTGSGVSPRAFPGNKGMLVVADSDEHDEEGHPIEDAETRNEQMRKRLRKMEGIRCDIAPPEVYGPKDADVTLIGWGSSYGAIREAVDILHKNLVRAKAVHFKELWPFPAEAMSSVMDGKGKCYVIESNATGQLAHIIRAETGKSPDGMILRYDGRPLTPGQIISDLKKEVF